MFKNTIQNVKKLSMKKLKVDSTLILQYVSPQVAHWYQECLNQVLKAKLTTLQNISTNPMHQVEFT